MRAKLALIFVFVFVWIAVANAENEQGSVNTTKGFNVNADMNVNGNLNLNKQLCSGGQCYYLVDANLGEDVYPIWNTNGEKLTNQHRDSHGDTCDGDNINPYTCGPDEEKECLDSAQTTNSAHHRKIVCKKVETWSIKNLPIEKGCWNQYPNLFLYSDGSAGTPGYPAPLIKRINTDTGCWQGD